MNQLINTSTPLLSSGPTNVPSDTDPATSQNQEMSSTSSDQDKSAPTAMAVPPALPIPVGTGEEGFEINLGIITISNLDLDNDLHKKVLGALIFIIVASLLYHEILKKKKLLVNKKAYQLAQDTFLDKLEIIKKKNKKLTLPTQVNFWDKLVNPQKIEDYNWITEEIKEIRADIQNFQREYRGQVNVEMENAIYHLSEVTTTKPLNIDAILVALEGVYMIASRLGLSVDAIHPIRSIAFQIKREKSQK